MQTTPLHIAAVRGNQGIVDLLLEHGADPSLRDADGNTPLHKAVINSHEKVVRLICRANPLVASIKNNKGNEPIQLSTSNSLSTTVGET